MCTFWQHLYGIQIFLVEVAAEKPSKRGQKWHFGCFSHFLEDFGLPSTPYNCSSHKNELQLGAHTLCAPFGNIRMVCGSSAVCGIAAPGTTEAGLEPRGLQWTAELGRQEGAVCLSGGPSRGGGQEAAAAGADRPHDRRTSSVRSSDQGLRTGIRACLTGPASEPGQ